MTEDGDSVETERAPGCCGCLTVLGALWLLGTAIKVFGL